MNVPQPDFLQEASRAALTENVVYAAEPVEDAPEDHSRATVTVIKSAGRPHVTTSGNDPATTRESHWSHAKVMHPDFHPVATSAQPQLQQIPWRSPS